MIIRKNILNFATLLITSLLLQLSTGPLIPDITVSISAIFFLVFSLKKRLFEYYKDPFFIILFFFYIYILVISFFSTNINLSLSNSLFYLRFILFSLFVCYIIEKNQNYFFKSLTFFLCFLVIFLIIDSYTQFFTNYNLFGFYKIAEHRLSGIFRDEYILGSFLIKILPIVIGLIFYFNYFSKLNNFYFILFFSLYFVLIVISGERSATFLLIVLLTCFFLYPTPFRSSLISISIISIILIVLSMIFNPLVYFRLIDTTIGGLINNGKITIISYVHQEIYLTSLSIFFDNSIFGIGPKMFREYCSLAIYSHGDNSCTTHPHNYYLQILLETGLIGFFIFLSFIIYIIKISIKLMKKKYSNSSNKHFYFCIIISILIYLWPLVPTGSFFSNKNAIFIFFVLGIFLFIKRKEIKLN